MKAFIVISAFGIVVVIFCAFGGVTGQGVDPCYMSNATIRQFFTNDIANCFDSYLNSSSCLSASTPTSNPLCSCACWQTEYKVFTQTDFCPICDLTECESYLQGHPDGNKTISDTINDKSGLVAYAVFYAESMFYANNICENNPAEDQSCAISESNLQILSFEGLTTCIWPAILQNNCDSQWTIYSCKESFDYIL